MMPKFGSITNPSKNVLREIEEIGKMGFDFAEIGIEGPEGMPKVLMRKKDDIKKTLKKYGLFATAHTAWWIELGTPHEKVRKAWVNESKEMIDTASELGVEKINFHFESNGMFIQTKKGRRLILKSFVASLQELVEYAEQRGLTVMLENGALKTEMSTLENYKYVLDNVEGLRAHLDFGHLIVAGGMENLKLFVRTFKRKLEHIHISDNYGVTDAHLPITVGLLDEKEIVKILKRIGYNKTITFEVFTKTRDLAKFSMEKFKELWKSE